MLLATFDLTLRRDLMEGIVVGFALAALLFVHRISGAFFFGVAATAAAALDRIAEQPRAPDVAYRDTVETALTGARAARP